MSTREDIESFFKTLLLGDFEENQNTAAQIVGGLISMVPVLDQVMDARDITGALFQINRRGGFQNADSTQLVNLGFAAFGAVPEVGSAFKTVFKPLWKERRAAKGAVHGGLDAIEGLLGLGKGGAIRWVRTEVLGKWTPRTQQVILTVQSALASCIALTEFLATASGWKDWLIPDAIQSLAKDMLPGLRKLSNQINEPLQRASEEIRLFLEDLLGEQAAAIAMGVGQRATVASAVPGSRPKSGHNAADLHPKGKAHKPEAAKKVANDARTNAEKGGGPAHAAKQNTGNIVDKLTNEIVGICGEHIADYICAFDDKFQWGPDWKAHDDGRSGQWTKGTPGKNKIGKLSRGSSNPKVAHVLYKLSDGANGTGIDAVWRADKNNGGKPYAIVEAKATKNEDAPKFMRKQNNTRKPSITSTLGNNVITDLVDLIEPIEEDDKTAGAKTSTSSNRKAGKTKKGAASGSTRTANADEKLGKADAKENKVREVLVQMSREWIEENIDKSVGAIASDIRQRGYARHLFYCPAYHPSGSPKDHMLAKLQNTPPSAHTKHDGFHYNDNEVKIAVNKRKASLRKKYGNLETLKAE